MTNPGSIMVAFTLPDQDGAMVSSESLAGGWYLLYWYPKADTPGCTAQAEGLRDQCEAFDEAGCVILGASFDEAAINAAFRKKYRLPFSLLSDVDRSTAVALGVVPDASVSYPRRVAYLVDSSGAVVQSYEVDDPEFFAENVLDDLEAAAR